MTRVVLDTNVLAPGLVGSTSASARLIDVWRSGAYELIVSEHLLSELARAFTDPYFATRLSPEQTGRIFSLLRTEAILTPLDDVVSGVATQPADDLVLSTGLSAGASYLGTRDRQLLKLERYRSLTIMHPVDLLHILTSDS
jgi:putative PIN family toxin of toxin-antitoxin system